MIEPHTAGTLNDGFQNQCSQFFVMLFHNVQQFQCVVGIPVAIKARLRTGSEIPHRQCRAEQGVHSGHRIAYGHCVPGISVIPATDGYEITFLCQMSPSGSRLTFGIPILYSHFHGYFHSYRTGVGIKYLLHGWRHQWQQ